MTDRFAYSEDREKRNAARVRALEALLIEKGVISAQIRWFVVPERPDGTQGMNEDELAALVTPETMMGVAIALPKAA